MKKHVSQKVLASTLACVMAVGMGAACVSADSSVAEAPTSDVTLEFQQWWGVELPDGYLQKVVDDFLARLKKDETQAEGGAPAAANAADSSAPAPAADAKADVELPTDDSATVFIHILLEDGVGMENLRAFMIVNALKENGIVFIRRIWIPMPRKQKPSSQRASSSPLSLSIRPIPPKSF